MPFAFIPLLIIVAVTFHQLDILTKDKKMCENLRMEQRIFITNVSFIKGSFETVDITI